MNQLGLTLTPTAYGYLQSNVYQNPELYHESVAHFSKAMGHSLFIQPSPSTQRHTATNTIAHSHCHATNMNDIDIGQSRGQDNSHPHDHYQHHHHPHDSSTPPHSHFHAGCGHHDDEITSIEQYYPGLDVNSDVFSIPYESKPISAPSNSTPSNPNPNQITTIKMSDEDHELDIGLNDEIRYLGLDASILHLKFIITGDQNAGKSTFLHSLTNSHDDSFLLLNRYLPILQGSFYNARLLQRQAGDENEMGRFIDEYPFIDTDVGLTQLFVTTDDLLLCLDDLAPQQQQQQQQLPVPTPGSVDNNATTSTTKRRVGGGARKQVQGPKLHSFDLYQDFLTFAKMDVSTPQPTPQTKSTGLPDGFQVFNQMDRYYPHVCLEFVELGGDHLDRLVQHLYKKKGDGLGDGVHSPNNPNNNNGNHYSSFVQQLCSTYQQFQQTQVVTPLAPVTTAPGLMSDSTPQFQLTADHTSQAGVDSLLQRTISLMHNTINKGSVSDGLVTPLSYFANLETLCQFSSLSSNKRPEKQPQNEQDPTQDTQDTLSILSRPEPSAILSSRQYCVMVLRMMVLLLVQHKSEFEHCMSPSSMASCEDRERKEPKTLVINTHLLRAPIDFYNQPRSTINHGTLNPQFPSPFNTYLNKYQSKQNEFGVGSGGNEGMVVVTKQETASSIYPDFLFNRGDLVLPIKPVIKIDAGKALDGLKLFLRDEMNKVVSDNTFIQALFDAITLFEAQYRPSSSSSSSAAVPLPWIQSLDVFLTNSINFCLTFIFTHFVTSHTKDNDSASNSSPTLPVIAINFKYSTHTFPIDQKETKTVADIRSEPGNLFLTIFANIAQSLGK